MKNVKYNYRKDIFEPAPEEGKKYEQAKWLYEQDRKRIQAEEGSMRSIKKLELFIFLSRVVIWFCAIMGLVYFYGFWGK